MFVIYVHTCLATGKKYIGQTKKPMLTRWREHTSDASRGGGCLALGRAIRLHGVERWTHEELEVVTSREEANVAEVRWIAALNTIAPNGYNLDVGGVERHPMVAEKIRATRASKSPEWQAEQNALLRVAHAMYLAESTEESRRQIGRDAWKFISLERRREMSRAREAAKTPEQRAEQSRRTRAGILACPPEERSARARASALQASPEERSAKARRAAMSGTPEERSERSRKARAIQLAAMTLEERSERSRRAGASRTPEKRSEIGRIAHAAWMASSTFEERSAQAKETARKAWITKRAKAAAKAAVE